MSIESDYDFFDKNRYSRVKKWFFRFFVGFALFLILYISGIHQYLLFRPFRSQKVDVLPAQISAPEINVPIYVYVWQGTGGSERSHSDIKNLIQNTSAVWHQARIIFHIEKIISIQGSKERSDSFWSNAYAFAQELPEYSKERANVLLLDSLRGINGVAFENLRLIALSDYTTSPDYRVLAHEFGHLFKLQHKNPPSSLMNSGSTGTDIEKEEINISRLSAQKLENTWK